MLKQIRQGDVCLVRVDFIPEDATIVAPTNKGHVLMWGEVTFHSHRFVEAEKVELFDAGAYRFIKLLEKTALTHEEHSAIFLDKGTYQQGFQVEDYGTEIRRVAD